MLYGRTVARLPQQSLAARSRTISPHRVVAVGFCEVLLLPSPMLLFKTLAEAVHFECHTPVLDGGGPCGDVYILVHT